MHVVSPAIIWYKSEKAYESTLDLEQVLAVVCWSLDRNAQDAQTHSKCNLEAQNKKATSNSSLSSLLA
jgi:hypothetical protein